MPHKFPHVDSQKAVYSKIYTIAIFLINMIDIIYKYCIYDWVFRKFQFVAFHGLCIVPPNWLVEVQIEQTELANWEIGKVNLDLAVKRFPNKYDQELFSYKDKRNDSSLHVMLVWLDLAKRFPLKGKAF